MVDVSLIVPVYNMEQYLVKCMDSLVNQTLETIEIVCVDDGSTDRSYAILKQYEEAYPDKVVVLRKENGGQATARNLGIQKSTGRYIGFVDSDDYVHTSMFEMMYQVMEEKHCDLVELSLIHI